MGMPKVAKCRFCGAFAQEGDRFCWSCGSPLAPSGPTPATPRPAAALLIEPDAEAQLLLRRAFLAQHRGNLVEAERLAREAVARDPGSVPALTLLSEVLRARGDVVGAVDAAQRAAEAASERPAPPGALRRAREERAHIEQGVIDELTHPSAPSSSNPAAIFSSRGGVWEQSGRVNLALALAGLASLVLALVTVLRGAALGYAWFGVSLAAAGWCYHDAETRRESGLFWGPLVLCLGPFGLAIYLRTRY